MGILVYNQPKKMGPAWPIANGLSDTGGVPPSPAEMWQWVYDMLDADGIDRLTNVTVPNTVERAVCTLDGVADSCDIKEAVIFAQPSNTTGDLCFKFRAHVLPANGYFLSARNAASSSRFEFRVTSSGQFGVDIRGGGDAIFRASNAGDVVVDTDYVVEVVQDGVDLVVTLNGVALTWPTNSSPRPGAWLSICAGLNAGWIGKNVLGSGYINFDVWDVVLSTAAGVELFSFNCEENSGATAYDSSGNRNHGTWAVGAGGEPTLRAGRAAGVSPALIDGFKLSGAVQIPMEVGGLAADGGALTNKGGTLHNGAVVDWLQSGFNIVDAIYAECTSGCPPSWIEYGGISATKPFWVRSSFYNIVWDGANWTANDLFTGELWVHPTATGNMPPPGTWPDLGDQGHEFKCTYNSFFVESESLAGKSKAEWDAQYLVNGSKGLFSSQDADSDLRQWVQYKQAHGFLPIEVSILNGIFGGTSGAVTNGGVFVTNDTFVVFSGE